MRVRARSFVAAIGTLTLAAYVLATAIHITVKACGPLPAATHAISASADPESHPQRDGATERHCHGCSSAAIQVPAQTVSVRISKAPPPWPLFDGVRRGFAPGGDRPPPKQIH